MINPVASYWVGVVASLSDYTVFEQADESEVTDKNYPQFDYCVGPFTSEAAASAHITILLSSIDKAGWFKDPFSNGGRGR